MKLHFLQTEWSDIIILEEDSHFAMVDTGFEEQFPKIRDYLRSLNCNRLDFILNTHFHRDHYGSIPLLLEEFPVDTVYLKEYSALDSTTAWGSQADDEYRAGESEKFRAMVDLVSRKSNFVPAENLKEIEFCGHKLNLFNTENTIRKIYEDKQNPDTFHKICFSENMNSLSVFFEADGKTVFLGGDMMDHPAPHPAADRMVYQVARKIGKKIDLYKWPHHATNGTAVPETLQIFCPSQIVITNSSEYVEKESDALTKLRAVNPDAGIQFTKDGTVVFSL